MVREDLLRDLIFTGRIFDGEEGARIGVVSRLSADPVGEALALAATIAGQSPRAVRAAKRLLNMTRIASTEEALLAESSAQFGLLGGPDQREAIEAHLQGRRHYYALG